MMSTNRTNSPLHAYHLGTGTLALAALTFVSGVHAQSEAEGPSYGSFYGSAMLSTDYVFRGISNSNEEPQVQVDMGWSHPIGFYGGVWSSNTDFGGAGNSMEVDPYVGFANAVGDTGLSYDVGYSQYTYPGSPFDIDYGEAYAIGSYRQGDFYVSPSVWYAKDYFGFEYDGIAYDVTLGMELPWELQASARVGEQTFTDEGSDADYLYYDVGATKTLGGFDLSLRYHDTDDAELAAGDSDLADGRLVFSVSHGF